MSLKFFDAHTHLQFAAFKDGYRQAIKRAFEAGVVGLVNVGTQKDTSKRAVEIAEEYPSGIYAAVGLHPIHVTKSYHDEQELGAAPEGGEPRLDGFWSRREDFDFEHYQKLALHPRVVAIGECGLDYYRIKEKPAPEERGSLNLIERQKEIFIKQIELAHAVKKPLMIHCRDAYQDLIEILNSKSSILNLLPGIAHFFSGSLEDAKKLLELGFYFTFGGVITFSRDYDEIIKIIPLDRILSETDAPYVAPEPWRGKRNESAYVLKVAEKLAEIKKVSLEKMSEQILKNAKAIFKLE